MSTSTKQKQSWYSVLKVGYWLLGVLAAVLSGFLVFLSHGSVIDYDTSYIACTNGEMYILSEYNFTLDRYQALLGSDMVRAVSLCAGLEIEDFSIENFVLDDDGSGVHTASKNFELVIFDTTDWLDIFYVWFILLLVISTSMYIFWQLGVRVYHVRHN